MFKLVRLAPWLASLALVLDAGAQATDYKALHNMLVQFYGYQRSGDKTIDNKNPFYTTSPYPHSTDALSGKDLSSGWYDAGDFVKFGLPFSFSTYCLLLGYDVFPKGYDDVTSWDYKTADQIPDILGEVKIATDYMMRAVISPTQIVVDVGNAQTDHQALSESGYANSSRTSPRQVYTGGGADVAGLYAASLALMSIVYKPYDAAYAASCLAKAKEAFAFGVANLKVSTEQADGAGFFYSTKTFYDKLACGGIELFRATKDSTYYTQAKSFQNKVVQHFFVLGYANAGDLSSFEFTRLGENATGVWLADVNLTMSRVVKAASAPALIKGAFINSDWGNAGNAASAGFSAALAFMVTGDNAYLDFARSQAHWVAGIAPFTQSYVVGFGNGPTAPHHRNDVAKTGGVRLKGGVVSGPTPNGTWDASKLPETYSWSFTGNDASNYKNTEVALNYNAGMVGLVAFLRDYDNPPPGLVRITTALSVKPTNVDLNTGAGAITGTLASAMPWTLRLQGKISGAVKRITGTGAAISASWAGESDTGSFVAGEGIDVKLDLPNIAPYHLLRASTTFYVTGLKKAEFKATDVVVDDFEDTDALTKQGGPWTTFTDKPTGTSSTNPATMAAAIFAGEGETATRGVNMRLIGAAGATHPVAGIRATFNAAGTAVSLGSTAASVVFDVKSSVGSSLWVEVEQADITDGAYFGKKIDFAGDTWMRIRVPFSTMAQPEWKTAAKSLNLGSVTGLRFSYYGTSNVRFNLDNVRVENLSVGTARIRSSAAARGGASGFTFLKAEKNELSYRFAPAEASPSVWTAEVMDFSGRVLAVRTLDKIAAGQAVRLQGLQLNPGWYFVRHTTPDEKKEFINGLLIGAQSP
ncbi:MAG: glycoside hydrolase family 9 protein [Saprospiraceae bacterium]